MLNYLLKALTLSIILGIFLYSNIFVDRSLLKRLDFVAYLNASTLLQKGDGVSLYDIPVQESYYKSLLGDRNLVLFRNPATLALLFFPLGFFPPSSAYAVFVIIGILLSLYCGILMSRNFVKINKNLIIFGTISFIPGIMAIITGQISFLLLTVWLLMFKYYKSGNGFLTGVFLGFLYNKPQYLLFTPFLFILIEDRKRFIKGFALSVSAHFVISVLCVGLKGMVNYPSFLILTESGGYSSDFLSQISFPALLYNISESVKIIKGKEQLINLVFYLLTLLFFTRLSPSKEKVRLFHSATLFTLIFLPHAWDYDLVLVLPTLFYLLNRFITAKRITSVSHLLIFIALYFSWAPRFFRYPFVTAIILITSGFYLIFTKNTSGINRRVNAKP